MNYLNLKNIKNIFISFEGIDGAGKTTHINSLKNLFESRGFKVKLTREPGGSELAEKIRGILLSHQNNDEMDSLTESLLIFAARNDHLNKIIKPAIENEKDNFVLISDRFTDASFAYQGGGGKVNWNDLKVLEKLVLSGKIKGKNENNKILEPDLTLWFDLSPEIAFNRLKNKNQDRFEQKNLEFFKNVNLGYQKRFKENPERIIRINANLSIEEVWQEIKIIIKNRFFK